MTDDKRREENTEMTDQDLQNNENLQENLSDSDSENY